jgi:subtilisin family serine protease
MKGASTLAAIAASISLASATVPLSQIKHANSANVVPGRYIVELAPGASLGKRGLTPHQELYSHLTRRGALFSLLKEFNDELFTGASLALGSDEDLLHLASTPGVVAIRPVHLIPRPQLVDSKPADPAAVTTPDKFSTHVMTGVDRLHAEGIFGKGVKIGIIDTGTDYTHPALGGGFGPGFKFVRGYDFVGDAYDGTNTPVPDNDPLDQCAGHGTHVAGIIGANPNNPFNISGVAYEAELGTYRVFGCKGSVADDVLVDSLLRANKDGNDIITLSIGGPSGWTEAASSVVASKIAASGKVVTIAAGNEGADGSWYSSGPAGGIDVISVASVDNTEIPVQFALSSEGRKIPYFSLFPLNTTLDLPVFAISNSMTIPNDGCDPLPDSTPDLSPFLVIIRRGTCPFLTKLENVAKKGARIALIYNNGGSANAFDGGVIPGALVGNDDGAYLFNLAQTKSSVTISFPKTGGSSIPNAAGGLVSTFSTFGPSYDMYAKPSVGAPGGGILSTLPTTQNSYGIESGTSMATPFVAGSAALILQAKGKGASKGLRTLLETTASAISSAHNDAALLQTAAQQGAGLINVYNAIHYQTTVSPGELLLNQTGFFNGEHTITVQNNGKKAQTYVIGHTPAGTASTLVSGTIFPAVYPVPLVNTFADVKLSTTKVTVQPGKKTTFKASIKPPTGLDPKTLPVYSGYITVASESGESLKVTYLGVAASLKNDATILDSTDTYFGTPLPFVIDAAGNVQNQTTVYTFKGTDFPTVAYRLAAGTAELLFDLVDSKSNIPTTIPSKKTKRDLLSWLKGIWDDIFGISKPSKGTFDQVKIVGTLAASEYNFRHTNSQDPGVGFGSVALSNNTFADGKVIPNGQYKVLIRALKITGDPKKEEDYESWLSPIIGFNA